MNKRGWREGGISQRGDKSWRLRYRVNGKRYSTTFVGSKTEAKEELRKRLTEGSEGRHVDPHRKTVRQWVEHWLAIGAPGKRKKKPGARAVERYGQLVRTHVLPELGDCLLQKLTGAQIDGLYTKLPEKIAPQTCHHVHTAFGAALSAAVRARELLISPMTSVLNAPSPTESDHGIALDDRQSAALVDGFQSSPLFLIVALAAGTGMRRNEILALRWCDFDDAKQTITVERALDQTKAAGLTFKPPKTKRGYRTIAIDDGLVDLLKAEREKMQRLVAGVPEGADVDLSLVKLPPPALMFPSPEATGDLERPREPHAVTRTFTRRAGKLGFKGLRFHDLRGSHATQLLRRGVPLDIVARRLGNDPAVMLRSYAKVLPNDDAIVRKALAAASDASTG